MTLLISGTLTSLFWSSEHHKHTGRHLIRWSSQLYGDLAAWPVKCFWTQTFVFWFLVTFNIMSATSRLTQSSYANDNKHMKHNRVNTSVTAFMALSIAIQKYTCVLLWKTIKGKRNTNRFCQGNFKSFQDAKCQRSLCAFKMWHLRNLKNSFFFFLLITLRSCQTWH